MRKQVCGGCGTDRKQLTEALYAVRTAYRIKASAASLCPDCIKKHKRILTGLASRY